MAPIDDLSAALYAVLADEHGEGLFDRLDDVQFWIKDRRGRYVRVNRALVQNHGFADASAALGRTDHELFPPHLADQYVRDDRAALAGRAIVGRVELVARPDRTTAWHLTDKIPLRDRRGRVVATAGITRVLDGAAAGAASAPVAALAPVVERLRAHYAGALDKPRLARLIGVSTRSLERRFAHAFGCSPLAYQRALRMHDACHRLVAGDEAITAIAFAVGYADHSHFTREFRRRFGVPPRVYRDRWSRGASAVAVPQPLPPARR